MPTPLEQQIQELLTKQNCPFCYQKVLNTNLAGFSHPKDQLFFLKKPICQDCWTKNSKLINRQNLASLAQINQINQKIQDFIKNYKEKTNQKPPTEPKIYEDWQKKLNDSK